MAQASQHYDSGPQQTPSLSPDEQRIANAVVAALQSELTPIRDTLEQHSKMLDNIQREISDINKILADAELIPYNPDI